MSDLVAFLRARLDEDEAAALDARVGRWEVRGRSVYQAEGPPSLNAVASDAWDSAAHIARHDPARVLREVDAKRKILDEHWPSYPVMYPQPSGQPTCRICEELRDTAMDWPCPTILALAAVYSDHPDYDPACASG